MQYDKNTKLFLIRFHNSLRASEVEAFRGAIINQLHDKDLLFHNHLPDGEGLRQAYPLVQYKRIDQKAAILFLGSGTDAIAKLMAVSDFDLRLNGRRVLFEIDTIKAYKQELQVCDSSYYYTTRRWLALNQVNYEKYNRLESLADRTLFLERILTGNILSFAKGLDVYFEREIEVKIRELSEPRICRYKGTKLSAFDVDFKSNVFIPNYVGLGKGASIGFGNTIRQKENNK